MTALYNDAEDDSDHAINSDEEDDSYRAVMITP
jgi:hypothetical protein